MSAAPAGRRCAVVGRPVAHSLSPVLHAAAYAALGLTGWRYDAVDLGVDELPGFVAGCGPEWAGLSVTMPLKRAALLVAVEATPLATAIGAANTLLLDGPGAVGADNTDVGGIADALTVEGDRRGAAGAGAGAGAVVLGAGGTAQAALGALVRLGLGSATVVVRDPARAADLTATAGRLGVQVVLAPWNQAGAVLADAGIVVSTVPRGAADGLAGARWRPGTVLLDAVYDPWPTPLAAGARAAGVRVVSGLDLLVYQAARQVRLMTGHDVPVAALRSALPPLSR